MLKIELMLYNTKDIVEATDAKMYLRKLIEQGKKIEIKGLSNKRSSLQNRALHKFFVMISEILNEQGQEFNYVGLKGLELSTRYTPEIVKNFFWRPIQISLFDIESTKKINTQQLNDIADVIIKYFGEKGIYLDFPRKDLQ